MQLMTPPALLEFSDGIATLTLNRPDRANVLDEEMGTTLISLVDEVRSRPDLRALLITGRGRHFCAGGDIQAFVKAGHDMGRVLGQTIPPLHSMITKIVELPVPVVTALNGSVGGGGIGLAFCADIVIGAESMKLRGGYSALGLTPDLGASWFLGRLIGPMRTKHLLFTNEPWNALECLSAGLIAQVVADEQLPVAARALVQSLANGASGSLARIKSLADGAVFRNLHEQLELECRYMVESGDSADAMEGARAFTEKRPPRFAAAR
jgi:2-(1,2-epoxy-1,2-dihydrophenyl)acetyl-CoA isomerase